ncbi:DUF3862 domain-containing protein [Companilactobacillus jidongensis]|uniref:DUF3862 domain-containing protein n=1 Tax=Companilactobacillus jidongensis TaxID=2486006 RepID=UPI001CDC03F0|nr:DUF3862 domain-containing protein [Companilactobacillus jidongensis]
MNNNSNMSRMSLRRSRKKPFFKKWWFWLIIALIVIAGVGFGLFGYINNKSNNTSDKNKTEKVEKSKSATKKKSTSNSASDGITLDQFNNIALDSDNGTSWDTIKPIFGTPTSHSTSNVQGIDVDVQTWDKVANAESGSSVSVGFANNHAISKTISGLKVKRDSKIDIQKYAQIESDQSTADIEKILGQPNAYDDSSVNGTSINKLTYTSDIKGDSGAKIVITFTNDKVTEQTQSGVK